MSKAPKKKPGRPRTRPANAVGIRCEFSPEDHTTLKDAAEASRKRLGPFVQDAAMEAARKVLKRS